MRAKPFKFEGIYKINGKLATVNLVPGRKVYGEKLISINGTEYRIWDPFRSKPAAALRKKLKVFPVWSGMKMLYLGIASGTTASHFSDIIGKDGMIFGVEISEIPLRDLIPVAEERGNIIPILADARFPENYRKIVYGKVDLVYEDIASPDQIKILKWNCDKFLKPNGYAMIAIKSQSIDVTKKPKVVYKECLEELSKDFEILDKVELDPFEKYHLFVVLRKSS